MMKRFIFFLTTLMVALVSCEELDNNQKVHISNLNPDYICLSEVAQVLSLLPMTEQQLMEVHDAVSSSSGNGYDEEYTMKNLFSSPGSGVGDQASKSSADKYDVPMRELIESQLRKISDERKSQTKGASLLTSTLDRLGVEGFLEALTSSDIQIYWPFSENWNGEQMPVITFDPEDGSDTNIGYMLLSDDGSCRIEAVVVDEEMARSVPVWVVNRNDDAGYTSLEMLRRAAESEGEGGNIVITPKSFTSTRTNRSGNLKTLLLKDFTMKRNYDSWFAGASEFFVKFGSLDGFTASTEAEMKLYSPTITDFMIVVKRNQVNVPQPFNAILVSDWTEQMTHCAFLITEDDGGTRTTWASSVVVKVGTKSYGLEVSFPINTRDDIVWRGQLSRRWLEDNDSVTGHFGDIDVTFEMLN